MEEKLIAKEKEWNATEQKFLATIKALKGEVEKEKSSACKQIKVWSFRCVAMDGKLFENSCSEIGARKRQVA